MRAVEGGLTLRVRVKPRSSRDAIEGVREGALAVRVTAPPVEGEANAAMLRLLGKVLGIPPSALSIVRGASGREKLVAVAGIGAAAARARLQQTGARKLRAERDSFAPGPRSGPDERAAADSLRRRGSSERGSKGARR